MLKNNKRKISLFLLFSLFFANVNIIAGEEPYVNDGL